MTKRKKNTEQITENSKRHESGVWNAMDRESRGNEQYIEYYKLQHIITDDDTEEFLQVLKSDLPITFRINEAYQYKDRIINELQNRFHYTGTIEFEGNEIRCVHPLSWYKENLIWEINVQRRKLKKIPQLKDLHQYLIELNDNGLIEREELVSMLPPLFLSPNKDDIILDLCASPGSKTLHLLEMISEGTGCVVANEANMNRISMLLNHVSCIPSDRIAVTHHLAQDFPLYSLPKAYDRVLCDVPCSGDGTLRKNPELWKSWNLQYSFLLHPLQCSILKRGLQCLKVGGCLVYSTCSLNPIEDEAVVATVLKEVGPAIRLKNVSDRFPSLQRQQGLFTWKVVDDYQTIYEQWTDSCAFPPSCFPSSSEVHQSLHLDYCMRFLPHVNNSGGFFIAVFEKVDTMDEHQPDCNLSGSLKTEQEIMRKKSKKERLIPFADLPLISKLSSFFGITKSFEWGSVYAKSTNHHDLYLVAPVLQPLFQQSEEELPFISTGLKVFEYNNSASVCPYKLCQEGLHRLVPHMTKRIVSCSKEELQTLLQTPKGSLLIEHCSTAIQEQLNQLEEGCCVFQYAELRCSVWRSKLSLQLLMKKTAIISVLRLLQLSLLVC